MGELAALTTALLWAITSILFSYAGNQIGSQSLNRIRLSFAVILLSVTHLFLEGSLFPLTASPERWFWLSLSGLIGLVLGDALLFKSFTIVGPRIAMLIMSLAPAIGAVLAWIFLAETLTLVQIIGISLTLIGIVFVVLDRSNGKNHKIERKKYGIGLLLSFGGAFGQAVGLILAKKGLVDNYSALSGVLIRMVSAMILVWVMAVFTKQIKRTFQQMKTHPQAIKFIGGGAFVGPFLGVWLSLIAVQSAKVGIASTLMALTPIFHLPIGRYVLKEKITVQAIFGTILAMIGVAIIFII